MSYPATLLRAGAGRRGVSSPAPSPEISAAHTPVERKLTGVVSVPPARVCSLARATSPAFGPGLSPRSPAGAPDRSVFSHRCGGVGCVLLSAALPGRARPQSKPVSRFDRPALNSRHGKASNRRQYARAGLHLSPLSGGRIAIAKRGRGPLDPAPSGKTTGLQCVHQSAAGGLHAYGSGYPGRAHPEGCRSGSPRSALTSSAMTADPRRADPGNPLAGAVSVLRRLPNWPVALRGGGHIAGVA